jgi:hypothetical protein
MEPWSRATKKAKRALERSFVTERTSLCKVKGPHKMAIRSNRGFWKTKNAEMDESEVVSFIPSASLKRTS